MYTPLLSTKLHRPQRRTSLVNRIRLVDQLQAGLPGRLTLVSTPPGFGKTTLIVEWLENLDRASAWISLDAGDNDPARFFAYLAAAFQQIEPSFGLGAASMLASPQLPPAEVLVTALLNDLAQSDASTVLVLDDYHTLTNPVIHQSVCLFLERGPAGLHLVLITREDPPLPLARLRARGELNELRAADLKFSLEEGDAFLAATMGLQLSPQATANLVDRTEGWIAGLQMAALALRSPLVSQSPGGAEQFVADFHGDDRYVMDYLMDEVFLRQSPAIQDFLLQTSVLDRLCASLCDRVIENREWRVEHSSIPTSDTSFPSPDSQTILEYLERGNLFLIPLDVRREWYRYHHLFADLLRYRLHQQEPDRAAELHRLASQWHREAGSIEEAMKHAQAIPDTDLVAELAEANIHRLINAGQVATCMGWITQIPDEAVSPRAYLCSGLSWACLLDGQLERAEKYLQSGELALPRYESVYLPHEGRWVSREEVRGQLTAIRAYRARLMGDFPGAVALSQQALGELPPDALAARCVMALNLGLLYMGGWQLDRARPALQEAYDLAQESGENAFVALTALSELGAITVMQGNLNEGISYFQKAIQSGTLQPEIEMPVPEVGYAHGWLGAVYYQQADLDQAEIHLQKALELVELIGPQESITYAYLWQARLALARCDLARAEAWLERVETRSAQYPLQGILKSEWVLNRGKLALARGRVNETILWLETHGISPENLQLVSAALTWDLQTRLPQYMLMARLLLASGDALRAAELLERVSEIAGSNRNVEIQLEALVFRALAESARRPAGRGQPYLEQALALAAPQGYARPFLEAGEGLVSLLGREVAEGRQPAYAAQLLARLSRPERRMQGKPRGLTLGMDSLVEPLTGREVQVLRLLFAGLSSTQIAAHLFLSVHTTRSYIKSLYRKLDAHTKEEALRRGQQLSLLEDPPPKPPR